MINYLFFHSNYIFYFQFLSEINYKLSNHLNKLFFSLSVKLDLLIIETLNPEKLLFKRLIWDYSPSIVFVCINP